MERDSDFKMASIPTNSMIPVISNLILGYLRPSEEDMLYRNNPLIAIRVNGFLTITLKRNVIAT